MFPPGWMGHGGMVSIVLVCVNARDFIRGFDSQRGGG
jgi:hypothetical protein